MLSLGAVLTYQRQAWLVRKGIYVLKNVCTTTNMQRQSYRLLCVYARLDFMCKVLHCSNSYRLGGCWPVELVKAFNSFF